MLHYMEKLVGEENMRQFLKTFISKYREQSVDDKDFSNTFDNFVQTLKNKSEIQPQVNWTSWLYTKGKFPVDFDFSTP